MGNAKGWTNRLVSGFGIEGITTFQGGFPLGFTTGGSSLPSFGAGTIRPNFVAGSNFRVGGKPRDRINEWFNTGCIAPTTNSFSYGNAPRQFGGVRSQGVNNWDMSLSKKTPIKKGVEL